MDSDHLSEQAGRRYSWGGGLGGEGGARGSFPPLPPSGDLQGVETHTTRRSKREEIFTFPPHAHFEALLEATVLALVAVVLVYGTVPVGPASVR